MQKNLEGIILAEWFGPPLPIPSQQRFLVTALAVHMLEAI